MSESEEPPKEKGTLRCLRCSSFNLERSGKEPYRYECTECGQHYFVVMQLVPVAPPDRPRFLEPPVAERRT